MGGFRNATRRSFVLPAATWLLGRRINRLVAQETTPSLDAEQAFRRAVEHLPLTVAYGQSSAAGSTFSWSDCPELMEELRTRLAATSALRELFPRGIPGAIQLFVKGVGFLRHCGVGRTFRCIMPRQQEFAL
jgi:hypothetical protein